MKFSLNLGKIAGIRISIHWSFLLLIFWAFYSGFSASGNISSAIWSVLFILSIFFCVVLHELGHALTAKQFDIKTESIILLPIGGVANMEKMPEKPSQELAVALAGPMVNIIIAGIVFLVYFLNGSRPDFNLLNGPVSSTTFMVQFLTANLVLVAFNLLPAFPMDGGRVFRAILSFFFDRMKATRIAAIIGQGMAVLFVLVGLFNTNLWLMLIGLFIFAGARVESRFEQTSSVLKGLKVKDVLMRNYTVLYANDTVGHAADVLLNGQEKNFLVMEDHTVFGILSRSGIVKGLSEYGRDKEIAAVANKHFIVLTIEDDLNDSYKKMMSQGLELCPVINHHEIQGVVDIENISEYLLVHAATGA